TFVLLFVLVPYSHQQGGKYCEADFCEPGLKNVGCNPPPTEGGPACSGKQAQSMSFNFVVQATIVNEHNKLRSLLARGGLGNFAPASHMPQLVWDTELANQAAHNVRSCAFGHDECRNTEQFQFVGQNIALTRYSGPPKSVIKLVLHEINAWWSEANITTQAYLDKFPSEEPISQIGHFTQMVSDRAWKVGCAAQHWTENRLYNVFYLVCNYSFTNMVGEPVYVQGPRASRCTTGEDKLYPGLFSLLLFVLSEVSAGGQYCRSELCPRGGPHVGCKPPSTSGGPTCRGKKNARKVLLTPALQGYIMDEHNLNRSNIALGRIRPYPSAVKMPTLTWDTELAALADANARSCNYGHDRCRATDKFPYAGQNIAITQFFGYRFTEKDLIHKFVSSWWSEYLDALPEHVRKYPSSYSGKPIGHFTQIASDRSTKVGCSMWYWKDGQMDVYYFVCNYSFTNIMDRSVYQSGPAGSECKKGRNSKFPGLCNANEEPRSIMDP
uniref:Venom allergen-1 n=1 Tax=Anopheles christyi TaxID=43041 RepID=A0A182KFN0_9DIPT